MSGDPQTLLQPAAVIGAMFLMLKFFVVEKLKQITEGLGSHEKRIRGTEITTARLQGALQAKGCLKLDGGCPLSEDEDYPGGPS